MATQTGRRARAGNVHSYALLTGLAVALIALACQPTTVAPTVAPTQADSAATTGFTAESVSAIRTARQSLGAPTVALAGSLERLTFTVAALRYPARPLVGAQRAAAFARVAAAQADVIAVAQDAEAAAATVSAPAGTLIAGAVALTADLAQTATDAADAAQLEVDFLRQLDEIDEQLRAAVQAWSQPGAQSQRRRDLGVQADAMMAYAAEIAATVAAVPAGCTVQLDNRVRWARVVAERSSALSELATGAGGQQYDVLRDSFGRQPFGEDISTADAAERDCWSTQSPVAQAGPTGIAEVERLEVLLQA